MGDGLIWAVVAYAQRVWRSHGFGAAMAAIGLPAHTVTSLLLFLLILNLWHCDAGVTSKYMRRLEASIDLPLDSPYFEPPEGHNAPEQVHITQGNRDGNSVIVSWITPVEPGNSEVSYGTDKDNYNQSVTVKVTSYQFYNYSSGYIHHAKLEELEYDTKYYYKLGEGDAVREFWFVTPPKVQQDASYTFGIIGDLGQSYDSAKTFQHYLKSNGQAVLYLGDLSYADNYPFDNSVRWDTWGRLVEPSTAYQAWIWTTGNHELEFKPELNETTPFKPFLHRYRTPYHSSGSTSPLWYSINRASAHIIVLSSYSAYGKYTPQWTWLLNDLKSINRMKTPWVVVLVHSPWYNSNTYHYMEGESMRVQFESWFVQYKVDIVFAGHVHAYERSHRISNVAFDVVNGKCDPVRDESAPIYVTVGDGGNLEGLAGNFTEPQPAYSAFREASFGHAMLEIKNRTHALYYWHRNEDGESVQSDSTWLYNRYHRQALVGAMLPRRRLPL